MERRTRSGTVRFAVRIAAVCAALASMVSVSFFLLFMMWSANMGGGLSRLAVSESRLPVSITVFGRSTDSLGNDTLSARIDFYTADGDLAGTVERSWSGWELKLDCVIVGTGSGWLVFPFRAGTDVTSRGGGVDLLRQYGRNGFPVLFESANLTKEERSSIRTLFALVGTERWMPPFFGTLRHETVSIRSFEAGTAYSLFLTKDGRLQLRAN